LCPGTAPDSDLTIIRGAEFNAPFAFNGPSSPIGSLIINGGTFRAPSSFYYLNKRVLGITGGTIDLPSGGLYLTGGGAGITVNATSTWTGDAATSLNNLSGSDLPLTIAPNLTLTGNFS